MLFRRCLCTSRTETVCSCSSFKRAIAFCFSTEWRSCPGFWQLCGAKMGDKPTSTTRGMLPGIPASVDRVSAECIWKAFCTSEQDYVRHRKLHPAQPRQTQISNLHGFEVVKNASYVSVRRKRGASSAPEGPMSKYLGEDTAVVHGPPPFIMPPVEVTPDRPPLVMPKYGRFSADHMFPLEMNPGGSESGKNLARAISMPNVRGGR
eukprot:gb/GFBE01070021.1/.p1 GENE.gb/GFBE01070021.1/~~gb/GFBE01070021.1/.p1  ORF type:complete len:206 (+),score=19.94 gb/GFBE01070021.1/:1-618(+)